MGTLSDSLRDLGFEPTGRESPVHEEGELWSNGHEIVCDESGTVIDGNHHVKENGSEDEYRYRNSDRVKLVGGHASNYDWGEDEKDRFRY